MTPRLLPLVAAAIVTCRGFTCLPKRDGITRLIIQSECSGVYFASPCDGDCVGSDTDPCADGRSDSASRRKLAVCAPSLLLASFLPEHSLAAPATDAGEAIRRSAAAIPGYGQSDVFYPRSFAGTWNMVREVELYGSNGSVSAKLRLSYPVRFLSSIEDDAVVADRGVNQAELEQAIQREINPDSDPKWVRSYEWAYNNPNDLRLQFSNGSRKEIKVTKRATERTATTVSSSEFQRITQEDAGRGIPTLSARRVLTKWKVNENDNSIEGLEIVYNIGGAGVGDPMSFSGQPQQQQQTVLSKSRLFLSQ